MSDDFISRAGAIKAICEDGTQLERLGRYSLTMTDRKQRDADILEALPSVQLELCKDVEFWRKRAEDYENLCIKLFAEIARGVKPDSIKIDENGITLTMKQAGGNEK